MTYEEFLATVDCSHQMTTERDHLAVLCRIAQGCRSILELGSHAGVSAAAMALANPRATIISVDLCDTVPQEHRVQYWASLGIENVHPVAGTACDYLLTAPRFSLVFHDAVHGDGAFAEYKACTKIADIVAIHDWEQLSGGNQALLTGLFQRYEATRDCRGRYLFVGWV